MDILTTLARENLSAVADADANHLAGDMERAFRTLAVQWLLHTRSLKDHYP